MNFCLTTKQSRSLLNKVAEIKIPHREMGGLINFINEMPDKIYIVDCYGSHLTEEDWTEFERYNRALEGRFILELATLEDLREAQKRDIKHYYGYPINSFFELNALKRLGIEYVIPGPNLFFNIGRLRAVGVKVRVIPNVAYNDGLPHDNGVVGTWIRPEDLHGIYADYIDAVEFGDIGEASREAALFQIYAIDKEWLPELQGLITNLNYPGINRLILPQDLESRLTCGQRCEAGGVCRKCYRVLDTASEEFINAAAQNLNGFF